MKKSCIKPKTNISKIPFSKISINKKSLDLSIPFSKKFKGKMKSYSIKDTFYGSVAESGTYAGLQNQENLKISQKTNPKEYSFGRLDNKNIFTYSLNSINQRNKSTNFSKDYLVKTQEENSENISSSEDNNFKLLEKKSSSKEEDDDDTNRIDYRYYPKIPEIEGNVDKNKTFYWLATYDKLMKKSKLIKILSYYSDSLSQKETEIFVIEDAQSNYKEEESKERLKHLNEKYNFKEKTMVIQGYEIYFVKKHGKPFVRLKKEGKLFIKLYLLSMEQINQIFSYINRVEYKEYIKNLNFFRQRNTFKIINNLNKTIYNYTKIFCLGTFMNTNIYMFSHTIKNKEGDLDNYDPYNINYLINNLPSSNKIAKLIKVLMINFPEFSKQYFIDYLMKPKINNINFSCHDVELINQKIKEVNSLLIADDKNELKVKNNNTNNIIKKTIRAIPTNTLSSKNTNNDINSINYINNDGNCSDFLSNIKNELDGLVNIQKHNNTSKNECDNKIYRTKTNKIKSNNILLTRNNKNIYDNINNTNDFYTKSNNEYKMNKNQNICRTISLVNQNKKSLTRNNSNLILSNNLTKNDNKEKEKQFNNIIKIDKKALHRNYDKENDINLLNKYKTENNNFIYYNKTKKQNKLKSELLDNYSSNNLQLNLIKNKDNIYSPYYTNNNNILDKNCYYTRTSKNTNNLKKRTSVLSTVEKLVSKKLNNFIPNTTNLFQLNKNNSSNSFKLIQNNRYGNNTEMNNNLIKSKKQKINGSKTNNNSLNKISDYITPLKKKYFYYYH